MTLIELASFVVAVAAAVYVFLRYRDRGKTTSGASDGVDAAEGSFWEVGEPLPAQARVRIRYVDARGLRTERSLEVRQFGTYGPTHLIIGHCQMRMPARRVHGSSNGHVRGSGD